MGFWKSFFSSSDAAAPQTQFDGDGVEGTSESPSDIQRDRPEAALVYFLVRSGKLIFMN
jgi:hypothetical protein